MAPEILRHGGWANWWKTAPPASTLAATSGNQSEAGRRLGLSRATLYDRLQRHGLLPEWRPNTLRIVNLYRFMAGLPPVTEDATKDQNAQGCALCPVPGGEVVGASSGTRVPRRGSA